jgi:mono/diheme cytochrome c family protein
VMPSEAFIVLDDDDLRRLIAFLRTLPAAGGPGASVALRPLGRVGFAAGQLKPATQLIADAEQPPVAIGAEAVRGRYLARTVCSGCHGTHLRGDSNPSFTSPNLAVVATYSPDAFARLLRTGKALGGRELRTMSPWSREHLAQLTDSEVVALYAYLHTLGS